MMSLQEKIQTLKKQIVINDEDAETLLIENNGDVVESILNHWNFSDSISEKKKNINHDVIQNNIKPDIIQTNRVNSNKIIVI